ncbi:MAG: PPC domain-containing protein [Armatimonadetes bacterium]|nr:PPC domain-containing protein [Armatimonadota bacterium]
MRSCVGLVLLMVTVAAAREPRLGYVYPAGGQRGTSFSAVVGGADLNDPVAVLFVGGGVQAAVLAQARQVTPEEQRDLRDRLGRLQAKLRDGMRLTAEERAQVDAIKSTLTAFGRRLSNPSLGEFITLRVTIAADATVGRHEVRLLTRAGLTNPRAFWVGDLPEYRKPDWKDVPMGRDSMAAANDADPAPVDVTPPLVLNGQLSPGCVDHYRFAARAGQRLTVAVKARDLIPYIADAVPGWLQATATLYDPAGREVAHADNYLFRPDPVLGYQIPADGTYRLDLRDSLYRGREDFVYRVTLGELPFVTGAFPAGGRLGQPTTVRLDGWNLPANPVDWQPLAQAPGLQSWQAWPQANELPMQADALPELDEREPNDTPDQARSVSLPAMVNGRLDAPGDWDCFAVEGRAGQALVAEVYGRRLDSPIDSVLRLRDPTGQLIAANDDRDDQAAGLQTHHADSYLMLTLPVTGRYTLELGDAQQAGGPAWRYRLRLSAPRPDFELRVTPSSLTMRGGANVPVTAFAQRRDGFDGDIALTLVDAPRGCAVTGAVIPSGQDRVTFTVSAPTQVWPEPFGLRIAGRAVIAGHQTSRAAVPADNQTQAFSYRHLVPAQDLLAAVVGRSRPDARMQLASDEPVLLRAGGSARVGVVLPLPPALGNVAFELLEPPAGVSVATLSPSMLTLSAEAGRCPVGWLGNLIVLVSAEQRQPAGGPPIPDDKLRVPLGALPAIAVEIVR